MVDSDQVDPEPTTTPPVAIGTSLLFGIILTLIPLGQLVSELWSERRVTATQLVARIWQGAGSSAPASSSLRERIVTFNCLLAAEFRQFESDVTTTAVVLQPPREALQFVLWHWLRTGNDQVVSGRDGSLYYRPDLTALTGRSLEQSDQQGRSVAVDRRQTAPLPAILRFATDLQQRGIRLILLPIPSHAAIPDAPSANRLKILHSPDFVRLMQNLTEHGIAVCDLGPRLQPASAAYLATDSHWSPRGLAIAAKALASQIRPWISPSNLGQPLWQKTRLRVGHQGDLLHLLTPAPQRWRGATEFVEIEQVTLNGTSQLPSGLPAEVLLLGDSFTNVYSQPELGWGTHAGLTEQLAFELQAPVDRLAFNAGGASTARRELVRQLSQDPTRLQGTKVVVWQFAERELALGDWQVLPFPEIDSSAPPLTADQLLTITGEILQAGQFPGVDTLPYRDALVPLHLRVLAAAPGAPSQPMDEIVVYVWGMRDRQLTPLSRLRTGAHLKLTLTPWGQVESTYGRIARAELDDPDFRLFELPVFWGETPAPVSQ